MPPAPVPPAQPSPRAPSTSAHKAALLQLFFTTTLSAGKNNPNPAAPTSRQDSSQSPVPSRTKIIDGSKNPFCPNMSTAFDPRRYGHPYRPTPMLNSQRRSSEQPSLSSDSPSNQSMTRAQPPASIATTVSVDKAIKIPGFDASKYGMPLSTPPTPKPDSTGNVFKPAENHSSAYTSSKLVNPPQPVEPPNNISTDLENKNSANPSSPAQNKKTPLFETSTSNVDEAKELPRTRENLSAGQHLDQIELPLMSSRAPLRTPLANKAPAYTSGSNLQHHTSEPKMSATKAVMLEGETPEQTLKRIRGEKLREIGARNIAKDPIATTSLHDLAIAKQGWSEILKSKLFEEQNIDKGKIRADLGLNKQPEAESLAEKSPAMTEPAAFSSLPSKPVGTSALTPSFPNQSNLTAQESTQTLSAQDTTNVAASAVSAKENSVRISNKLPSHNTEANVTTQSNQQKKLRNSKWCTNADLKSPRLEKDSNAWGSEVPSDAPAESNDSVKALDHGKRLRSKPPDVPETNLVGWDGKLQPPPVDWNDRPRFNNNHPDNKNGFNGWVDKTVQKYISAGYDNGMSFKILPQQQVEDLSLHPDGLGLVLRAVTVDYNNAEYYGYSGEVAETTQHAQPFDIEEWKEGHKLEQSTELGFKFDPSLTTDALVEGWNYALQNKNKPKAKGVPPISNIATRTQTEEPERTPNPNRPKINIYLRPAVKTDIPQLTAIYNWHIEHGVRAAECVAVDESDMRSRFENAAGQNLPFIVAVLKAKAKNQGDSGGSQQDTLVGFACAQDFTAADMVERLSAEVEIYVHAAYLNQGVGRCLLDQLLQATDRGYNKKGGYTFHCDPQLLHLYTTGGGRDMHKLVFVVRHHQYPIVEGQRRPRGIGNGAVYGATSRGGSRGRSAAVLGGGKMNEEDFVQWIKPWLERWEFEQEGCLRGIGTKDGRFLNVAYLCMTTKWQPAEGHVPGFFAHPALGVQA